jgi:hypothetical protein
VHSWANAVNAPEDARATLAALAEAALNEVDSWRGGFTAGLLAMQQDIATLEATAGVSRHFQPAVVPGLLQTAEYARRVFEITDVRGWGGHEDAVAARMERQQILYQPGKRFEFLLTEAALRLRIGPQHVIRGQADRLASLMSLENVNVAVIPFSAEAKTVPWCGFHLYDDLSEGQEPFVTIEMPHARLTVSDPGDVAIYQQQLVAIRRAASHGRDARLLLEDIAHS